MDRVGGVEVSSRGVRQSLIWVLGCLAAVLALPSTASASQTFTNSAPITIKDGDCAMSTQTVALPFKSNITVAGAPTVLDDVEVVIHGLTHRYPKDIRMLLVGPGDRTVLLMHEAGGLTEVSNVTLTFDDAASGPVTEPIASGSYQPTRTEDGCMNFAADNPFPGAPPNPPNGPFGTALDEFNGTNPNGIWSLYIVDDSALGTGSISGGWSLVIGPPDSPTPPGSGPSPGSPPITPSRKKCKKKHRHLAAASKKGCKKKK
jgi:subtilisin-like proprotein convertase family protein